MKIALAASLPCSAFDTEKQGFFSLPPGFFDRVFRAAGIEAGFPRRIPDDATVCRHDEVLLRGA